MKDKINLFFVDDEPEFRNLIGKMFSGDNYNLKIFENGNNVIEATKKKEFDVGVIDIKMPDMDGIELLKKLKSQNVLTEFLILTGYADVTSAVESMKYGCYDYLTKPVKFDELDIIIQKAYEKKVLQKENIVLKDELLLVDKYHDLLGKSPKMKLVYSLIEKVAKSNLPVLIMGESGTGKELTARAIHKSSDRNNKSFIVIDCAALSETLLENELFGHEKGAFTDATSIKRGLFEVADGGMLFIDEIGEMKPSTQAKLLRVIETKQFRRLGGTQQIKVDVRIIAATNRDLIEEMKKNNFREDLYYRLNVLNINLPPLKERKEDIPLLVKYFIANSQMSVTKKRIREADMKILMEYDWPGNVRELVNIVERALITTSKDYITSDDFAINNRRNIFDDKNMKNNFFYEKKQLNELINDFEKDIIIKTLKECKNNRIMAAKELGLSRSKLYRKLEKYGIKDVN